MENVKVVNNLIESLLANEGLGYLIDIIVKSSLLLFLIYTLLLFLRKSSSTTKHLICFFALLSTLMIPPVSYYWPNKINVPVLPAALSTELMESKSTAGSAANGEAVSYSSDSPGAASEAFTINEVKSILIRTYVGVLLLFVVYFIVGLINISFISLRSEKLEKGEWFELLQALKLKYQIKREIRILTSREVSSPLVWGLFRPVIIIPFSAHRWNKECKEQVLLHEISHIKRFDFATQLLAFFACVLYWFNPLMWFIRRNTSLYAESACDDLVIMHGINPVHYAKQLVHIAESVIKRNAYHLSTVAMSGSIELTDRVHAILNHRQNRTYPRRFYASGVVVLIVFFALCLSSLQVSRRVDESLTVAQAYGIAQVGVGISQQPVSGVNTEKKSLLVDNASSKLGSSGSRINNGALLPVSDMDNTALAANNPFVDSLPITENGLSQAKIASAAVQSVQEKYHIASRLQTVDLHITNKQNQLIKPKQKNHLLTVAVGVREKQQAIGNKKITQANEQQKNLQPLSDTRRQVEKGLMMLAVNNTSAETIGLPAINSEQGHEKIYNNGVSGETDEILMAENEFLFENHSKIKEDSETVSYVHEIVEMEVKKEEPVALSQARPRYPKRALLRNIEGWSVVEFTVTHDGYVKDIKLLESSNDVFVRPSLNIVKKWKYKPATYNGEAVEAKNIKTKITYQLSNT